MAEPPKPTSTTSTESPTSTSTAAATTTSTCISIVRATSTSTSTATNQTTWPWRVILITAMATVLLALLVVHFGTLDAAPYPVEELAKKPNTLIPRVNQKMLHGSEMIGKGQLLGPEDIVYDPKLDVIYTSCVDGWIKRVRLNDSMVEDWVNTGGRPLGLALGHFGEVYVADAFKGLLKITKDGELEMLTNEADGVKFGTTDGVTVAKNGILYFTDASWKYDLHDHALDIFEGRPNGRLMSYDPSTKQTKVIARDLYYANGVEMSPDQDSVIFCETPMMRCMRYYIQGDKEGLIDVFIDRLPGLPDNIHYDGDGHYWIAILFENSYEWDLSRKYPYIRKVLAFLEKHMKWPSIQKNAGVVAVDLNGKLLERYYDPDLKLVTTGTKIREHLYLVNLMESSIIRFNLTQYPATSTKIPYRDLLKGLYKPVI